MAILRIRTYPDPVLRRQCRPLAGLEPELIKLAEDMAETMYQAKGLGLAAPQVGELHHLVVVDSEPDKERGTPLFLFNPRIVEASGSVDFEEGCLSLPGHYANVTRPERVVLEALDREGRPITITAEGILARCLQHECDHLDGRLVLDHISPLKRALYKKRRIKEIKKEEA